MRRASALFAALAAAVATLAGCGHSVAQYDTMCVNPITRLRVDYTLCSVNPLWVYYVPYGYVAPGVGVRVNNYTVNNTVNHFHLPSDAAVHTGAVPTSGGKVTAPTKAATSAKVQAPGPSKVNLSKAAAPKPAAPKPAAPKAPAPRVSSKKR